MNKGKIYVVGIGPGRVEDMSIRCYNTLKSVDEPIKYIEIIF